MKREKLTLVPVGGLANRMFSVASAYNICRNDGIDLRIIWFRDWALNARFYEIFKPIEVEHVQLRESKPLDYLLNDRPRKKNFFIPRLPQMLIYDRAIYEDSVTELRDSGFDFSAWANGGGCYLSSYHNIGGYENELFATLFHPVDEVMDVVQRNCDSFSDHTIGVHIRRTDHIISIKESPTELFINAAKSEIDKYNDTKIYLATDDQPTKREFLSLFGDRVITMEAAAARGNADGIRGGLVDMWTLSRTAQIYGSANSTFSVMASKLEGKRLTVLRL